MWEFQCKWWKCMATPTPPTNTYAFCKYFYYKVSLLNWGTWDGFAFLLVWCWLGPSKTWLTLLSSTHNLLNVRRAFNVLRCLVALVVGVAWSLAMAAMKCTSVRAGGIISILAIQGQMGQVVECPLLCCEWKTTGWLISWFCGMAYMKIWGPADQVLLQCDDFWIKIGLCGSFQGNCSLFLRSPGERKENLNDTSRWSEGHWVL